MAVLVDTVMAAPTAWRARKKDQLSYGLGHGTGKEAEGEYPHAEGIDPFPTHEIADLADNQHGAGADQDIGHRDPHHSGEVCLENLGKDGKGDVCDTCVHGSHNGSKGYREEGFPFVGVSRRRIILVCGLRGH